MMESVGVRGGLVIVRFVLGIEQLQASPKKVRGCDKSEKAELTITCLKTRRWFTSQLWDVAARANRQLSAASEAQMTPSARVK